MLTSPLDEEDEDEEDNFVGEDGCDERVNDVEVVGGEPELRSRIRIKASEALPLQFLGLAVCVCGRGAEVEDVSEVSKNDEVLLEKIVDEDEGVKMSEFCNHN